MIHTKKELKEWLKSDNKHFYLYPKKALFFFKIVNDPEYLVKKYLAQLRKQEFYINKSKNNKFCSLLALYYERKKHKYGNKLGFLVGPNCCGKGLTLSHHGTVIINPESKVGNNCVFHGNNCVGNKGITGATPRIGNNVDIGFGAVIIGDIDIADNITIGANSLVNKSFYEEGIIIAGVPAKRIK